MATFRIAATTERRVITLRGSPLPGAGAAARRLLRDPGGGLPEGLPRGATRRGGPLGGAGPPADGSRGRPPPAGRGGWCSGGAPGGRGGRGGAAWRGGPPGGRIAGPAASGGQDAMRDDC